MHLAQDHAGAAQDGAADLGRFHPLGLAQEQRRADLPFDFRQHPRGGGLGHRAGIGGKLQLAMFGDLVDQPQLRGLGQQAGGGGWHINFAMQMA